MARITNKMADMAAEKAAPSKGLEGERKWRAQDAMNTMMRAHEHMADPAVMKDVQSLAKDQIKKLGTMTGGKTDKVPTPTKAAKK